MQFYKKLKDYKQPLTYILILILAIKNENLLFLCNPPVN